MAALMKFLGMKPGEFKAEWARLSDQDKAQLKAGITDGTYTY